MNKYLFPNKGIFAKISLLAVQKTCILAVRNLDILHVSQDVKDQFQFVFVYLSLSLGWCKHFDCLQLVSSQFLTRTNMSAKNLHA